MNQFLIKIVKAHLPINHQQRLSSRDPDIGHSSVLLIEVKRDVESPRILGEATLQGHFFTQLKRNLRKVKQTLHCPVLNTWGHTPISYGYGASKHIYLLTQDTNLPTSEGWTGELADSF